MPSVIVNKVFIFGVGLVQRSPGTDKVREQQAAAIREHQRKKAISRIARLHRLDMHERIRAAAAEAFDPPDDAEERDDARVIARVLVSP